MVERVGTSLIPRSDPITTGPQFLPVRIDPLALEAIKDDIALLEDFVQDYLEPDIDWGTEIGIKAPFLHEPGADKVNAAFNAAPRPEVLRLDIDEDKKSITAVIRTELISRRTGEIIGYGLGVCSTKEGKYGARWVGNPEEEGYDRKSLRKRKKRDSPNEIEYKIPNPDWGDLVHTIPGMAAKRGKVDAAQALPGVSSALRKLFKQKPGDMRRQEFARFYADMRSLSVSHMEVHAILQVKSLYDWLETHTFKEAREKVLATQGIKAGPKGQGPDAPIGITPEPLAEDLNIVATDPERKACIDTLRLEMGFDDPSIKTLFYDIKKKGWTRGDLKAILKAGQELLEKGTPEPDPDELAQSE